MMKEYNRGNMWLYIVLTFPGCHHLQDLTVYYTGKYCKCKVLSLPNNIIDTIINYTVSYWYNFTNLSSTFH